MSRYIIMGTMGMLLGGGLFLIFHGRDSKAGDAALTQEQDENDKINQLEKKIDKMSKEMQRVSLQSNIGARLRDGVNPFSAQAQGQQGDGQTNEPPPDIAAMMEKSNKDLVERYGRLLIAHERESRDPVWATNAETEVGTIVRQLQESGKMTEARIISSECRTNMCKVEVAYDSKDAQIKMADKIRSQFFGGGEVRRFEENGELRSTAYLYREGFEAPQ